MLLVFLIIFGMSATQASRFNWDEIRDHINLGDEDIALFGHNYSYEDQLQQDFPAGSSLRITSDRGAVNLTASDDNQIHVTAHKRINADSQGEADKYQSRHQPANRGQRQRRNFECQYAGRRRPHGHNRYGCQRSPESRSRNLGAARRRQRAGPRRQTLKLPASMAISPPPTSPASWASTCPALRRGFRIFPAMFQSRDTSDDISLAEVKGAAQHQRRVRLDQAG